MDPNTPLQPVVPPANPVPAGMPMASPPLTPLPTNPSGFGGGTPLPASFTAGLTASKTGGLNPAALPTAVPGTDQGYGPQPAGQMPINPQHDLIERLRTANNVLVTVSNNPSVDQLSAAIGLTIVLNKLDKHATAVYSGKTPSAIEFLQPDKTLEKNTDSLRDFIIALDKAKADKLRYKVEDKFVKIFITPYHTSLSDKDLEFSQGDFNVDVVVAIGVHKREELDEAITAHGRILHDAVTASVNNKETSDLGTINWFEPTASSLCEMVVGLIEPLQGEKALLDEQIATAFLTGVVAETDRFSNEKTTPHTMNIAATLMKAGANQQLVSSKLEAPQAIPKDEAPTASGAAAVPKSASDGSLAIDHKKEPPAPSKTLADLERDNKSNPSTAADEAEDGDLAKIHIDEKGTLSSPAESKPSGPLAEQPAGTGSNMVMQPPSMGGAMSAVGQDESGAVAAVDEPLQDPGLSGRAKTIEPLSPKEKVQPGQTLSQIEQEVNSTHTNVVNEALSLPPTAPVSNEDAARQAVQAASAAQPGRPEPIAALNAQPIDLQKNEGSNDGSLTTEEVFPTQLIGPDKGLPPDPTAGAANPTAPPPVPPPMMPVS